MADHPNIRSLKALRQATMRCRQCPIGELATQSVIVRGQWIARSDGLRVLITLHPSALLRMAGERERELAFQAFVQDLRTARQAAPAGKPSRRSRASIPTATARR